MTQQEVREGVKREKQRLRDRLDALDAQIAALQQQRTDAVGMADNALRSYQGHCTHPQYDGFASYLACVDCGLEVG